MTLSTRREYFEAMYAQNSDPWGFATSPYEQEKYRVTIAALPRRRYTNAFEPGCSIGVLTEMLAARCERLLATDVVAGAVLLAVQRLKRYRHVRVEDRSLVQEWPEGRFDLVVLSEIAYYFDEATLRNIMDRVVESTVGSAHVIGVHWRGETDYPLSGDRTHELIDETEYLDRIVHFMGDEFVLDVWERST